MTFSISLVWVYLEIQNL